MNHASHLYFNLESLPFHQPFFHSTVSADTLAQVGPRRYYSLGHISQMMQVTYTSYTFFTNATSHSGCYKTQTTPLSIFFFGFWVTGSKPE